MSKKVSVPIFYSRPKEAGHSVLTMNLVSHCGRIGQIVLSIHVTAVNGEVVEAPSEIINRIKSLLTRPVVRGCQREIAEKA